MKFFLLDKQQNIIGRLSEEYILEATFTEEINTAGELLITLPAKKRLSGNVIHVLITNPSKDHSYLMFKIIKETVKDEEVEYTAVESAYDELTSYGYIQDKRPTANAQTITEMILKDTRWHVGEIPDTSETFISFYYLSVLDCLKKIVQTFDFEIGFDVLINDDENQITDRRVNFYIKQGEQTGKRFEYGSNLLSVKQEQDTQNIYTALVGRGKGVQVSGGDDDNTPDGYGRRITFADVEWNKANGDPLDKPQGQEWLEDPDATKQLGFSDGHMRIGLEVFEDVDDPKVLLQKTYEALKTAERPQVQFSASVINTGELHLGDRVGITRNDIGIAYETRVFKVQHNLLDETQNKIDLGDNLEQTNNLSYQVSALQSEVTNNTEGIITVTQSANGKNKVYYSSTMPATGSNGDVWYKDLGNGETEMYIYDNGWQLVISTENLHKIEDEIKQQQTALGQAVQDANAASAKADGLVAQVGDANTNAQKALTTAQQNQADLAQAKNDLEKTKNQLTNVQSDLTGTKSSLAGAISNISQAQEDLKNTEQGLQGVKSDLANDEKNLSGLTKQAQTQGQTIVDIQKTQSGLSADIADVKGNVSSLQDTANGLQATVGTLNSDNLISNSDCLTDTPGVAPDTDWKPAWDWLYSDGNLPGRAWWYGYSALQLNRQISSNWAVFSAPVKSGKPSQDTDYAFNMKFYITTAATYDAFLECGYTKEFKTTKDIKLGTLPVDKTGSWQSFQATCTVPRGFSWVRLKITSSTSNPYFWIAQPMLSYGTTQKPYVSSNYPAQKMASISETVDGIKATVSDNANGISQIKQTAQSIQSDVANNKNDISSIKQTADSLKSSIQDDEKNISSLQQTAQGLQGSISDNKNNIANIQVTAQGLQTSVEDNKKNISTIQQQAGTIESAISTVNSDNLVPNSDMMTNTPGVAPNTDWKPAWGWLYSDGAQVGRANWYAYSAIQLNQLTATKYAYSQGVSAGKTDSATDYAISVKYMLQNTSPEYHIYLQAGYDSTFTNCKDFDLGTPNKTNGNNYCQLTATVNVPANMPWIRLKVTSNANGYIWIAQPMIVYGTDIPAQYISSNQPGQKMSSIKQTIDSIQSTVQGNTGQISQLKQTSDSLTSQIGNANNDISSLKQRADSMESNISDNKNDISDLKQTASSLQSNIQSKTDISQFTQLSNAFQTVVQNIGPFYPDGDFSDVDLGKYYDPWDTCPNLDNFSVVTNNKDWGYYLQIYTPHGTINKAITKEYLPINAQYSLTFKGKSLLSYGGKLNGSFMVYMHFFDSNKNAIQNQASYYKYDNNNNVWQDFSLSFTPPSNAAYVRVETVLDNSKGDGVYWGALDNLSLDNGGSTIASKISQMSDDINLRVQKGDLLSQINIQAGSTLIQSKKLFLDASSVVFSGNAFIPSAAITDLSADKITTGTLNAGNVNIINLDVNKLVGNTTEFVRSGWTNAYGSHVQIDGGGMTVNYGNWYTRFDGNGMTFKDGGDNLGGFTRVGMTGAPDWYNGLAFNAGGDAEFLSIGAQDYGNDNQNPVPAKLLWMRSFDDKNRYGYQPGWNFCDTVWADDLKLNHIGTSSYKLDLVALSMNGETAFGLQSGNGYGFWWGANGGLGIYGGGKYVNFTHTKFINDIQMGQGGSINWSSL